MISTNFLGTYHLKDIVKGNTCFKNRDRLTCIKLILTNLSTSFQGTCTVEIGLSDFTVLKLYLLKKNPLFKHSETMKYSKKIFRLELHYELLRLDVCNLEFEHFLTFLMKFGVSTPL